ncbi:hypothetical protein NW759_008909 [Fusarium solani]|nr:hypothetical protein NW759_008909 [Fusarium solani]
MDTISLSEYATEIDGETITGLEHLSLEEPRPTELLSGERPRCVDCNKRHIPRRFVYCVDGTWMVEDGPEGCFEKNPSNIFRVYLAVKEGRVTGKDGQEWEQKKGYYKGLGARQPKWKKYWQGGSGDGYEELIAEVYEHCAKACCPSQDELFLFGYSRGAFVVRAVAGLFNDLGTLKLGAEDWDGVEMKGTIAPSHTPTFIFYSPRIQFLGLFDTVKSIGFLDPDGAFSWLNNAVTKPLFQSYHYDIRQTKNTHHARHALALLENRDAFKPERVTNSQGERLPANNASRTCLEAWFLGFHADMGGGSKQDGLSLWPLQWILSEAARYGLFLKFQAPERLVEGIQDPMEYTMPEGRDPHQIPFKNGATVQMWDLNEEFNCPNLQPAANEASGPTAQLSTSERVVSTDDETATATIVHPSVFWADDVTPLGIRYLNPLSCSNKVRQTIKDINIRPESLYWNLHHTRVVSLQRNRPRVLICGPTGVGKSTLVNEVLGEEVSLASSGLNSVRHEIDTELTSTTPRENGSNFIFHDANGFERGLEETLRRVHGFIEKRQEATTFEEQLHCIWYCCNSVARMEEADREFIRSTSSRGVPFIVVFTKYDFLRRDCLSDACRQYCQEHPDQPAFRSSRIPADIKADVESRRDSILDSRCQERRDLVNELSTGQCEICFVTAEDEDAFQLVQELCHKTQACLMDDILIGIHDRAMIRYLGQALQQASPRLAETAKQIYNIHQGDGTNIASSDWSFIVRGFQEKMDLVLPPIYRLDVAATLSVEGALGLFSALDAINRPSRWWDPDLGLSALLAVTAVGGVGAVSAAGIAALLFGGGTVVAGTSAACAILTHEKLFWLGIKEIRSKEILARAVIEVMKQLQEMVLFLEKVDTSSLNDFEETLSNLVANIRPNLRIVAE